MTWYRVHDEISGHEFSRWSDDGTMPEGLRIVDEKPAVNVHGVPLPAKTQKSLASLGGSSESTEKPVNRMTVAELRSYAESEGIDLGDAAKKGEILSAIQDRDAPTPAPEPEPDPAEDPAPTA